jgi:hypothetical protein
MHDVQTFEGAAKVPQVDLKMEEAVTLAMHMGVTAGLMHSGRRWNSRDEIMELGFAIMENADPLADVKKFAAENAGLLMLGKIFGLLPGFKKMAGEVTN